jgi:methyl-accepting chemotaxis protein
MDLNARQQRSSSGAVLKRVLMNTRKLAEEVRETAERIHQQAQAAHRLTEIARRQAERGRELSRAGGEGIHEVVDTIKWRVDTGRNGKPRTAGKDEN